MPTINIQLWWLNAIQVCAQKTLITAASRAIEDIVLCLPPIFISFQTHRSTSP